ncbi:unnamed protein product [Tuber aestivum]|uniref:Stress-associated endoplasmic reticulum protein n=1 Tax=Tuber aestivum TaxID=59557 RepID=A0A292Q4U6_9PEZI|nr:unnamed protein product [Tuber aestivum]
MSQAQTPQQRRANEKFAKREEAKRGKPEKAIKKQTFKSPISQGRDGGGEEGSVYVSWVYILLFIGLLKSMHMLG